MLRVDLLVRAGRSVLAASWCEIDTVSACTQEPLLFAEAGVLSSYMGYATNGRCIGFSVGFLIRGSQTVPTFLEYCEFFEGPFLDCRILEVRALTVLGSFVENLQTASEKTTWRGHLVEPGTS